MEPVALVTWCRALVINAAAKPPLPHMQTVWGAGEGTEGFSSRSLGLDSTFISPYMRKKTWPQEHVLFGLGEKIGNQLKKKSAKKKSWKDRRKPAMAADGDSGGIN